jgi:hypothetical protein
MKSTKPKTRTGASKPSATRHLSEAEKRTLEVQEEAEHASGRKRERLTRKMTSRS